VQWRKSQAKKKWRESGLLAVSFLEIKFLKKKRASTKKVNFCSILKGEANEATTIV